MKCAYGYSVSVKGYDMTVEFRHLAKRLEKNYTVVIPEYFGYGLSDSTGQDRTVQRIANELHECFQKVGFHQYYFVAHSISGIYSLYYANRYPNEVKGFIGIDSSVPGQWERTPDKWKKLHRDVIEYKEKSQVYLLDGGHYLHYEYGTEIADRIHRWIMSL